MRVSALFIPLALFFALARTPASLATSAAASGATSWDSECDALLQSVVSGEEIAEQAGLHYVTPGGPGITRTGNAKAGFQYLDASGKPITDPATLQRVEALKIPPGYKDVWISEDPDAHIQATALDARGREQYRYHPKWIAAKAQVKFARMIQFGNALDSIHSAEQSDLAASGLPENKMLAALAQLLEKTSIRVGNARYAVENESFGLTTLLSDQVQVEGDTIHFAFKGKSGVFHDLDLQDQELATVTEQSLSLHQKLAFEYLDEAGSPHKLDSTMVNAYLKRISGGHFSAKDFRTWGGTTFAAKSLLEAPVPKNMAEAQKNITAAIEYAASRLGNTPAVCRSNYVDPELLDAYLNGDFAAAAQKIRAAGNAVETTLKPEEQLVLDLLGTSAPGAPR